MLENKEVELENKEVELDNKEVELEKMYKEEAIERINNAKKVYNQCTSLVKNGEKKFTGNNHAFEFAICEKILKSLEIPYQGVSTKKFSVITCDLDSLDLEVEKDLDEEDIEE